MARPSKPARSHPPPGAPPAPPETQGPSPRPPWRLIVPVAAVVLAAGLAGRLWLSSIAPRWAYNWDHFDNIQMGRTAAQHGLWKVYSVSPDKIPPVAGYVYSDANDGMVPFTRQAVRKVNYPPLGVVLFRLQDALLSAVDPGPVNTFTSRAVMSLASVLAELVGAAGVFWIAWRLAGPKAGLLAAVVVWLMPPLAMDSSFWGQTDGWFVAPAVLSLCAMLAGRWAWAGVAMAVTALLKPHGIFLGPVGLFGAWILPQAGAPAPWPVVLRRAGRLVGAGAAALIALSLPWTIADGADWVQEAYIANFRMYGETTLKAFNVWYLDVLSLDGDLVFALDSRATLMGITKDSLGRLGVLASLTAAAWLVARRYRRRGAEGLVLFAALWIWSTFVWPTRVHERYIVLCVPLVVAAAGVWKRLWPAAAALAIVGTAELCHNVWLDPPPGSLVNRLRVPLVYDAMLRHHQQFGGPRPALYDAEQYVIREGAAARASYLQQRRRTIGWEYALVLLSLGAYGWAFASPFAFRTGPPAGRASPPKGPRDATPGRARR